MRLARKLVLSPVELRKAAEGFVDGVTPQALADGFVADRRTTRAPQPEPEVAARGVFGRKGAKAKAR